MDGEVHIHAKMKRGSTLFVGCFALSRKGSTEARRGADSRKRRRSNGNDEQVQGVIASPARKRRKHRSSRSHGEEEKEDGVISISSRESSFDATSLLPPSNAPTRSSSPVPSSNDSQNRECRSYLRAEDEDDTNNSETWGESQGSSNASSYFKPSHKQQHLASPELEDTSQPRLTRKDKGKRKEGQYLAVPSSSRPPSSTASSIAKDRVSASPERNTEQQHAQPQTPDWLFGEEIPITSDPVEQRQESPPPLPDADLGEDDTQTIVKEENPVQDRLPLKHARNSLLQYEQATYNGCQPTGESLTQGRNRYWPKIQEADEGRGDDTTIQNLQEGDDGMQESIGATALGNLRHQPRAIPEELDDVKEAETPSMELAADKRSSDLLKIFGSEAGDIEEEVAQMHPMGLGDEQEQEEEVPVVQQEYIQDSEEDDDDDVPIMELDIPAQPLDVDDASQVPDSKQASQTSARSPSRYVFEEAGLQIPEPAHDSDYDPGEEEEEKQEAFTSQPITHSATPELEEAPRHVVLHKKASPSKKTTKSPKKPLKQNKVIAILSDSETSTVGPVLGRRTVRPTSTTARESSRESSEELEQLYPPKSRSSATQKSRDHTASVSLASTNSAAFSSSASGSGSGSGSESDSPEEVFHEESDTSDDARYKDASSRQIRDEIERAKRETKDFFPSSSLTPLSGGTGAGLKKNSKKGNKKREKIVRGRLTAAQKGKGREDTATTTETEMSEEENLVASDNGGQRVPTGQGRRQGTRPLSKAMRPVTLQSGRRSTVAPPLRYTIPAHPPPASSLASSGPSRPFARQSLAPIISTLPPPPEANPASSTRSRTSASNPNANSAQCHRCEAFHPKNKSLTCVTCDGAICQRCLVEHYSDQAVYVALLKFLVGQLREDLKDAKNRQKIARLGRNGSESTAGVAEEAQGTPVGDGNTEGIEEDGVDEDNDFPIAQMKKMFTLPSSVDLSTLDFQCPVCKLTCMCANCLRGPYPKGHPRHKASLLAAAAQVVQPIYSQQYAYDDSFAGNDFEDDPVPVVCASSNNKSSTTVRLSLGAPSTVSRSSSQGASSYSLNKRGSLASIGSMSHSQAAYDQARAFRSQADEEETDYVPVVSSRPRPTIAKPKNVVPRLGSPTGFGEVADSSSAGREKRPMVPRRRSARVRLATTVGQQLGKSPANLAQVETPKEPIFTLPDGTMSNEAPAMEADATQDPLFTFDDAPPREPTPEIQMSLDEENRLVSTFTSLASGGDSGEEEEDLIPDFALSNVGSLPELDHKSPSDNLTTASASSTSSLASPSANEDLPTMLNNGMLSATCPDMDTFMHDTPLDAALLAPYPTDTYDTYSPLPPPSAKPKHASMPAVGNHSIPTDQLARAKAAIYLSSIMSDEAVSQYLSAPSAASSPSKSGGLNLDSPDWAFGGLNEPVF